MFKRNINILTAVISLCLACSAWAQTQIPANVTGVAATYQNGKLGVSWKTSGADPSITAYRIYFSRVSILGNQGNYDDYVQTTGPVTSYTFDKPPYYGRKIFFSVMAVNTQGVESEGFVSEASVTIPAAPVSSSSSSSVSSSVGTKPTGIASLSLTKAEAFSASGVIVSFSDPLSTDQTIDRDAFVIVDASGSQLKVLSVNLSQTGIILTTDEQVPGRVYVVGIIEEILDIDGNGLASSLPQTSFLGGTPMGTVASNIASSEPVQPPAHFEIPAEEDTLAPGNPRDLKVITIAQPDGSFTVTARWNPPADRSDLRGYNVYTSDDGKKFGQPSEMDKEFTSVKYDNVSAGTFGVRVTSRDEAGNESAGVTSMVTMGNVQRDDLPHSGIGLIGIALASGFIAMRNMRKRARSI